MLVPVFLEFQKGDDAVVLPFDDLVAFFPSPRRQLDIAHPPVVIVLAETGVRGHVGLVGLNPLPIVLDRFSSATGMLGEVRVVGNQHLDRFLV